MLHFSQNRGVDWRRETAEESLDLINPGSGDGSELDLKAWMPDFEVLVRPPSCEESRRCFRHPVAERWGFRFRSDAGNLGYSSKNCTFKRVLKGAHNRDRGGQLT